MLNHADISKQPGKLRVFKKKKSQQNKAKSNKFW